MTDLRTPALLVARILLAVLFLMAGTGKLADVSGFAGYMASGGVPAFLAWPVVLFEILGGLAMLVGLFTRPVALALGAFTLLAGILYHYVPADQGQMTHFLKKLAITAGFLLVAAEGAGKWSVDALLGDKGRAATA